jgi:hypothetical protein
MTDPKENQKRQYPSNLECSKDCSIHPPDGYQKKQKGQLKMNQTVGPSNEKRQGESSNRRCQFALNKNPPTGFAPVESN